ncbi:MAG: DUF2207 domain-containing protein, partial [Salinibacterium sp.]|nr:DUF2207 domain-containing protein [Salinibacterium sp.]
READGTSNLLVVETIVARFPDFDQNRGIIRAIPDDYDGVPLNTSVQSVTDQSGAEVAFDTSYAAGFVELALGTDAFVLGVQTYVISYMQQNVVRSFADTSSDEFYWDVNGTGWPQPFGQVTTTVHIDEEVAAFLTGNAACYVGAFGENEQCAIEDALTDTSGTRVFTSSASNLAPFETLTVSIGFAPETFLTPEPTPPPEPRPIPLWMLLLSGSVGLASIGGLIAAIVSRVRAGGAKGRGVIIAQYSEPDGIDILQSAQLISRGSSGIPAAVVRLAVRKNLRILAYAVEENGAPYTLQYLTDARADALDLGLLKAIFGGKRVAGELKPYGKYDSTLALNLGTLSTAAKSSLEPQGFQRKPTGRRFGALMALAQVLLVFLGIGVVVLSVALFTNLSALAVFSIVGAFFGIFIATGLAIRPMQLTEKGREAKDFLEGMKLYLTVAEEERLRVLQSPQGAERIDVGNNLEMIKLYEKLLPWAVLWGVEDGWMRELELRVASIAETPDWFVGRNGFEVAIFSTALRGVNTTMTSPSSSWSSSGSGSSFSGGSSGGGFSGGGGGGGGGGGR